MATPSSARNCVFLRGTLLGAKFRRIEAAPPRLFRRRGVGSAGGGRGRSPLGGVRRQSLSPTPAAACFGLSRVCQSKQLGIGLAIRERFPACGHFADGLVKTIAPLSFPLYAANSASVLASK